MTAARPTSPTLGDTPTRRLPTVSAPAEVAEALAQMVVEAPCTRFVPGWWDLPASVREQVHVWLRQHGRHVAAREGPAGLRYSATTSAARPCATWSMTARPRR